LYPGLSLHPNSQTLFAQKCGFAKEAHSLEGLMMKSGMELRRLEDDYKAMVVQTIDITD
jgi:hypothetical protein